jgi:imidazole glycerol phosphate synthase subunit hisH
MKNILIINTNCANLSSVKFAFERLGYSAEITNDLNKIKSADINFTRCRNRQGSNVEFTALRLG